MKFRKTIIAFFHVHPSVPFVRLHGTARLPLDGFLRNLIFECFSKICRVNSRIIKTWQKGTLYLKTNIHFWIISASVLLRMKNVWDKSCRENQNTRCVFNYSFFSENRALWEIMWKNTVQPYRSLITIWHIRTMDT